MKPDRIRKRLLNHNPLASVAAADPWTLQRVDVAEINRLPFEGVSRLLAQLARTPSEPLAALILGEVGTGKSHLAARLRLACQTGKRPAAFALITPPENGIAPFGYLLREISTALHHPLDEKNATPWRHLANRLLPGVPAARKWKQLRNASFLERMPPMTHELVELIVRRLPGSAVERRAALSWLRGEIRAFADLPARFDRSGMTTEAMEDQARALLIALGALLAQVRMPFLICWDRLEDLRSPDQHAAMDLLLTFLVDRMEATLPVLFARGQFWEELRQQHWNAQTVGRMESNRFEMTGCARSEAEALVRSRLESVLGPEGMAGLLFDPATLLARLPPGRNTPRVVLTLANRCLQEQLDLPLVPPEDPLTRLTATWETMLHHARNLHDQPMRPERLAQVLRLYLFGEALPREGEEIGTIELPAADNQPARLWLIETQFHPKAIFHRFEQGVEWLQHHPEGQVTLVRDGRYPLPRLPKWPETNRMLQRFLERGGRLLSLAPERVLRWHTLGALHDAVRCGEITWTDGQQRPQPVPLPVLVDFLRNHCASESGGGTE
ncbi:MAG: hypothetical protein HQL91_03385 [Magnetococcales bacterium]|nr:hypothetical protein [Magnetococcales bacterium]